MELKKKKKGNRKLGSLLFSLVMAIALFITLLMVEKTLMTPNGLVNVYIATSDIEEGTIIDESKIDTLFKVKEVDGELAVTGYVSDPSTLVGRISTGKIGKGAVVSGDGFEDLNKYRMIKENPMYITIAINGVDTSVAGKIRPGDVVSVLYNNTTTGQIEELVSELVVEKTYDASGAEVDRGGSGSTNIFGFYVDKMLANKISKAAIGDSKGLRLVKIQK